MAEYAAPPKTQFMRNLDLPSAAIEQRDSFPPPPNTQTLFPSDDMELASRALVTDEMRMSASLEWKISPAHSWALSACRFAGFEQRGAASHKEQRGEVGHEVRERLLDLVSCAGRPKVWDTIAAQTARPEHLELLRKLALEDASYNVRSMAARLYARVVDEGSVVGGDAIFHHQSSMIREEAMMGAADRGSRVLLKRFVDDEDEDIAQCAREYLDDLGED